MEPFTKESGSTKGIEVLFLEEAEVQKVFGTRTYFASAGSLSVLYFKDYNRFVLRLNDWLYPIMRRIPIFSENGIASKIYLLPTLNGFSYRLILSECTTPAFANFEKIITTYGGYTSGDTPKLREKSPDDKLVRPTTKKDVTTSVTHSKPSSTITGLIKSGYEKVKSATLGLGGTKHLTSNKKRVHLKDIKTKNFRRDAKPTFKKNFFKDESAMAQKFLDLRGNNPNNLHKKDISEFRKISDSHLPILYLNKEDVEEAIFKQKDLIEQRLYDELPLAEKENKGIVNSIRSGITGIKESVSGMIHREAHKEHTVNQPETLVEHYQG